MLQQEITRNGTNIIENITIYKYDKNGSQISKQTITQGNQTNTPQSISLSLSITPEITYERSYYDNWNRLIKTITQDKEITYNYKPNGLRNQKQTENETTTHIWNGTNIIAELNTEGQIKDIYTRGIGLVKSETLDYYQRNGHGDVVAITD